MKSTELRAQLLQGEEWKSIRPSILRSLDWSIDSYESLEPLKEELDITYHQVIENWDTNPAVQIDTFAGKERIILTPGSGAKIVSLQKLNKRFLMELNFMLLNQRFHG